VKNSGQITKKAASLCSIFCSRRHRSYDISTEFEWLAALIELEKAQCCKTLIFAHSINTVSAIYQWLMCRLRQHAFRDGRADDANSCFVSMFHAHIAEPLQQYTLSEFAKPDSVIRVLVCIVAFSMRVAIGDVHQVIRWGKVHSLMTFWQEVGRCGRDGESSRAIWYPESVGGQDKALLARIRGQEDCVRLLVLQVFKLPQMSPEDAFDCLANRDGCSSSVKCVQCTCALCRQSAKVYDYGRLEASENWGINFGGPTSVQLAEGQKRLKFGTISDNCRL